MVLQLAGHIIGMHKRNISRLTAFFFCVDFEELVVQFGYHLPVPFQGLVLGLKGIFDYWAFGNIQI